MVAVTSSDSSGRGIVSRCRQRLRKQMLPFAPCLCAALAAAASGYPKVITRGPSELHKDENVLTHLSLITNLSCHIECRSRRRRCIEMGSGLESKSILSPLAICPLPLVPAHSAFFSNKKKGTRLNYLRIQDHGFLRLLNNECYCLTSLAEWMEPFVSTITM